MQTKELEDKLKLITTCIFDVDGVLTDGNVLITESGEILRSGYAKDGYVLQLAVKLGMNIVILTGTSHKGIESRFKNLGIEHIFLGSSNKLKVYNAFVEKQGLTSESILYMADDIPDIDVFKEVGVSACPIDAAQEILDEADYISSYAGGRGCVRDILEKILKLQGKWMVGDAHVW